MVGTSSNAKRGYDVINSATAAEYTATPAATAARAVRAPCDTGRVCRAPASAGASSRSLATSRAKCNGAATVTRRTPFPTSSTAPAPYRNGREPRTATAVFPGKPRGLRCELYNHMIATTTAVSAAIHQATAAATATARMEQAIAKRRAASRSIAPAANGRSGCATRSMFTSAMSLVVFATAVSASAARIPAPTPVVKRPALHHAPAKTPNPASTAFRQRTSASHSLGEDTRVEVLVSGNDVLLRKPRPGVGRGGSAHGLPFFGGRQDVDRRSGHALDVADFTEGACHSVAHHLGQAASAGADHGDAARQRFESTEPERLALRRQQEQVGASQEWRDRIEPAEKHRLIGDAERFRFLLRRHALGAVPNHHQYTRHRARDVREDAHDVAHALDRSKVGDVHEHLAPRLHLVANRRGVLP